MEENIKAYEKPKIIILPLSKFFTTETTAPKVKTKKASKSFRNKGVKRK